MSTGRNILAISLLVIALMIGIWDVYVTSQNRNSDTVSATLLYWSYLYPVMPLLLGILLGHIFWPQRVAGAL